MATAILEFQLKVNTFYKMEILLSWIVIKINMLQTKATFCQIRISCKETNEKIIEGNLYVEHPSNTYVLGLWVRIRLDEEMNYLLLCTGNPTSFMFMCYIRNICSRVQMQVKI